MFALLSGFKLEVVKLEQSVFWRWAADDHRQPQVRRPSRLSFTLVIWARHWPLPYPLQECTVLLVHTVHISNNICCQQWVVCSRCGGADGMVPSEFLAAHHIHTCILLFRHHHFVFYFFTLTDLPIVCFAILYFRSGATNTFFLIQCDWTCEVGTRTYTWMLNFCCPYVIKVAWSVVVHMWSQNSWKNMYHYLF